MKYFILAILLSILSCKKVCEKHELTSTIYEYIDDFESDKSLESSSYTIRVYLDSTNSKYNGYRINTYPFLLDSNELPNKIDKYKKFKITLFTEKVTHPKQIQKMKNSLKINDYYIKEESNIDSNYSEWVLLENKESKCTQLLKYTRYQEIDTLIKMIK